MHGLFDLLSAFAISDHLGVEKPHRRMFEHALVALGIPEPEWPLVAMVGNNLARDIRGANALGLISIWMVWNQRYPLTGVDDAEKPVYQVSDAEELGVLLEALNAGHDPASWSHPRPFPWDS